MTKDEMKSLGIVKKAGRKGTRFLLKTKDLSGKERYVTLKITDTSSKKEISAEIQKARIKLKKDTLYIKKLIRAWHVSCGHAPASVATYSSMLRGLSLDPDEDRRLCLEIAGDPSLSLSTRAQTISTIRAFFRWLRDTGTAAEDPTAGMRVRAQHEPRKRVLTDSEIARIMQMCVKDLDAQLALLLMLHTGCRKSTAILVTSKDLKNGSLSLYNAKKSRPYAYPIPVTDPALIHAIERGYKGDPVNACQRLARRMRSLGPDDSNEYATPHTLRHTWATRALRAGVPIDVISRILDHSSIAITLRVYARHSDSQLTDAVKAVSDALSARKN